MVYAGAVIGNGHGPKGTYSVIEGIVILDDHTDRLSIGVINNELEFLIPLRVCAVADCLSSLHTSVTHCHLKHNKSMIHSHCLAEAEGLTNLTPAAGHVCSLFGRWDISHVDVAC